MPAFHRSSLLSPSGTSLFLFGCTNSITLDSCCQIEFVTWYMGPRCGPGAEGSARLWRAGSKGSEGKVDGPLGRRGFALRAKGCVRSTQKRGQRRIALAPPLGGEGHEVARGCATASEVSDSLVGKYQSTGRHQTSDRLYSRKQGSGRLYIMKGAMMIKPGSRPGGRGKTSQPPLRAWKCTPSAAFGGVSPGGGDFSGAML